MYSLTLGIIKYRAKDASTQAFLCGAYSLTLLNMVPLSCNAFNVQQSSGTRIPYLANFRNGKIIGLTRPGRTFDIKQAQIHNQPETCLRSCTISWFGVSIHFLRAVFVPNMQTLQAQITSPTCVNSEEQKDWTGRAVRESGSRGEPFDAGQWRAKTSAEVFLTIHSAEHRIHFIQTRANIMTLWSLLMRKDKIFTSKMKEESCDWTRKMKKWCSLTIRRVEQLSNYEKQHDARLHLYSCHSCPRAVAAV